MRVEDLPAKTQDYLKVTWDLYECIGKKVALGDVAGRMGEKKPAASEVVKKLAARGLVNRKPYRGISLSDRGRDIALIMAYHHWLIESFLVSTLGHIWDEVHKEAEKLEHAVLGEFIDRIDMMLGFPKCDPHGNPIPSASGTVASAVYTDLTDIEAGTMVVVDHINDSDPELLRYLATLRAGPEIVFRVEAIPYVGMHVFIILDGVGDTEPKKVHVTSSTLWAIKTAPTTN